MMARQVTPTLTRVIPEINLDQTKIPIEVSIKSE